MRLFDRSIHVLAMLVACIMLTSCATIFTGSSDDITFNSEPSGATILIDGLDQGTTPAIVSVKRPGLGETQVVLKMDGYEDKVFTLQSKFNAVSILNFAGIIGWGIDIATGAVKKYSPKGYNLELEPESSSMLMEDLPRDLKGAYILPSSSESLSVIDSETGLTFIFN